MSSSSSTSDCTVSPAMLDCAPTAADQRSATQALLQDQLKDYAERLSAVSTMDVQLVKKFRKENPKKFIDLCKFHLSLLIDLPQDFDQYVPADSNSTTPPPLPQQHRRKWNGGFVKEGIHQAILKRLRSKSVSKRKGTRATRAQETGGCRNVLSEILRQIDEKRQVEFTQIDKFLWILLTEFPHELDIHR